MAILSVDLVWMSAFKTTIDAQYAEAHSKEEGKQVRHFPPQPFPPYTSSADLCFFSQTLRCVNGVMPPAVLAYDDACHLLKFWQLRTGISTFVSWLLSVRKLKLVVDRFHFKNHVGAFCKRWVDPSKCAELSESTQTEAAEQSFSWLARSKHMFRKMSQGRFRFMLLHMLHERNQFLLQVPIKRSMSRAAPL